MNVAVVGTGYVGLVTGAVFGRERRAEHCDYILLDRNVDRITTNPALRERYAASLGSPTSSREYEIVWQRGEYLLLTRKAGS